MSCKKIIIAMAVIIIAELCNSVNASKNPISNFAIKYRTKEAFKVPIYDLNETIIPRKIKYPCNIPSLKMLMANYSPDVLKNRIHKEFFKKSTASIKFMLKPVKDFSILPFGDAYLQWLKTKKRVNLLILIKGSATIQNLYKRIHNNSIIEKINKHFFIIKTPIFIGRNSKLLIEGVKVGLAFNPVSPIICAGKLAVVDSTIETWDIKKNRFLSIGKIPSKFYYLYGTQNPRPYIATIQGGTLFIISSTVKALGYRGLYSTFGISVGNWSMYKKLLFFFPKYENNSKNIGHNSAVEAVKNGLISSSNAPSAILVGNNIVGNYMGFFSSRARNIVIIGNVFDGNFQYNIDPHDWTNNITIAFNIIKNARKAHGIVFSRFVRGRIFNNLSMGNSGAGIMLDRISQACINNNIVFYNNFGGITLLESDNGSIINNMILRNGNYGIYIRNSLNVLIRNNHIVDNGGSGVEVLVVNIAYQIYRNLYLDAYHLAASAWQENNIFKYNFKGCIKDLYAGEAFFNNKFPDFLVFKGTIGKYLQKILKNQNKKTVIIPGRGSRKPIKKKKVDSVPEIIKYLSNIFDSKNQCTDTLFACGEAFLYEGYQAHLAGCNKEYKILIKKGINSIIKSAVQGNSNALYELGLIAYLSENKTNEWLILISEATVMGNKKAEYLLYLLHTLGGIPVDEINNSLSMAYNRLISKNIIGSSVYKILCDLFQTNIEYSKVYATDNTFNTIKIQNTKLGYYDAIVEDLKENNYFEETLRNQIEQIKKRTDKKNKNIEAFFKWENKIQKKYVDFMSEYPRFIAFSNRAFYSNALWKNWLKIHSREEFELIKSKLEKLLKNFNRFRESGKKIPIQKNLKSIRRKYFE